MTSNPEPIVQQVQHEFQKLLTYVTGPDARLADGLYRGVKHVPAAAGAGRALLRLFFVTRAGTAGGAGHRTRRDAPGLPRSAADDLLFGLWQGGLCAARLRRPWAAGGVPAGRGAESAGALLLGPAAGVDGLRGDGRVVPREQTVLERILGLSLSVQALETVTDAGEDVTAFYEQPAEPPAAVLDRHDPGGASRWQRGAAGPTPHPAAASPPGQGPEPPEERGGRHRPLHHCPLPAHPPGGGRGPAAGSRSPGPAARPRPVSKELRATLAGKAAAMRGWRSGRPARGAPHPAPRGADRWRRALQEQVMRAYRRLHAGAGHHPCHGVSVGRGQRPAGGDPPAARGLGPRLPGAAAGGADRRRPHGVGGRGG